MILRIKHLQHAKLYLFTHVTNTKSMTPNQLRFRASGFKGFLHIPLGPCSGFKAKRHGFYFFLFLRFFFFLLFLFLFGRLHWSSYMGNKTYYGSSTGLRPALQSEKRCIASQPIGTIWSVVCELAKGGMFKVEYAGTYLLTKN